MKRKIITTSDGSKTIQIEDWNEQYHSIHGAINEADHVFIKHGLQYYVETTNTDSSISIMEIGFGTGLNAFLTRSGARRVGEECCGTCVCVRSTCVYHTNQNKD